MLWSGREREEETRFYFVWCDSMPHSVSSLNGPVAIMARDNDFLPSQIFFFSDSRDLIQPLLSCGMTLCGKTAAARAINTNGIPTFKSPSKAITHLACNSTPQHTTSIGLLSHSTSPFPEMEEPSDSFSSPKTDE